MNKQLTALTSFLAISSVASAEIVINDFLSFEGFIDMAYYHTDVDASSDAFDSNESDNFFGVDQVEISWLFDFDPVTAQIDLQHDENTEEENEVEQAFATYHFDNGLSITAGRFASMLGFEAFEPTGLYQFSFAYTAFGEDFSNLPGYHNGVKLTYETGNSFFGIGLNDGISNDDDGRLGGDGDGNYAVEVAYSIYFDNGLAVFIGGAVEDNDNSNSENSNEDAFLINTYATYETGAWIFAAEFTYGETNGGQIGASNPGEVSDSYEGINALLMANFSYSENASITGRVSYADLEEVDDDPNNERWQVVKYTLAHNYAFTDNLLLVAELSLADAHTSNSSGDNGNQQELLAALELLFTF